MTTITVYQAKNGKRFDDPLEAMREDMRHCKEELAQAVKAVCIVQKDVFEKNIEACRVLFLRLKGLAAEYWKVKAQFETAEIPADAPEWLQEFATTFEAPIVSEETNVIPLRKAA